MDKENYETQLEKIKKLSEEYYSGQPSITDEDYDKLSKELIEYENKHKIENGYKTLIGTKVKFHKENHLTKMYSIKDAFDAIELKKFLDLYPNEEFYIDHKYDGASLNLIYKNGVLVKAITRGDGEVGENVTFNFSYIENIPSVINYKEEIEIRGEVLIRNKDFFGPIKDLYPELSNPRNTASGTLRTLDADIVKNRKLVFQPYGIGYDFKNFKTHKEVMDFIFNIGFKNLFSINPLISNDFKEIKEWLDNSYNKLSNGDFEINLDGAVLRVNNLQFNNEFNLKYPKFMLAFKYPYMEKTSRLLNIKPQVGRTGIITPVGVIEPVNFNGVTVTSVTLHNYEEIKIKDLRLGDTVGVIRSGEVIPKITLIYKDKRNGSEQEILPPTECPACGSKVIKDGFFIKCISDECSGKLTKKILHFANRDNFNITGMGESIVEELIKQKKVSNFSSIFDLSYKDFMDINNMKDKSINNILQSIDKAKNVSRENFFSSLGIPNFSTGASKILAKEEKYLDKTIEEMIDLKEDELKSIEGLGDVSIECYVKFMKDNNNEVKKLIKKLNIQNIKPTSDKLKNKSFCITGDVSVGRKQLENIIIENGGKVLSNVRDSVILISNSESSSSKYKKALELKTQIITEKEFMDMIKENKGENKS